jgi:acetolactate decarboxylase
VAVLVDRALRELLGVETHSLYQVSTAGALVEGLYQGAVSVGVVREHGDFGLGTFEELDGEMVVLDGIAYRVGGDGAVTVVDDEAGTPFAVVTRFDPSPVHEIGPVDDLGALTAAIDRRRPSDNVFFAVRVDGHFDRLHVRAACRTPSGVPLVRATEHQAERELSAVDATMVGFWSPHYASGLEVDGYHLHVLTADRRAGGHLLGCRAEAVRVQLQLEGAVRVALPGTAAFLRADLSGDPAADLDQAEHWVGTIRRCPTTAR